jgi:general secretion pathway protein L
MTTVITRFPVNDADDPKIWRVIDGVWHDAGTLSEYLPLSDEAVVMALVPPSDVRTIFSSLADLEPRQAEGVARLRATEQSIGPVHAVARHVIDDIMISATISPTVMESGLVRLALRGLNPDIVIPAGLAIDPHTDYVVRAGFEGITVLRGRSFAIPDEPALRDLLVGDQQVEDIELGVLRNMLLNASALPVLNLREGIFAKREQIVWATPLQRLWIKRLLGGLVAATILLGLVTWMKQTFATNAEDDRALAAAQKIDPAITDIAQAEAQLDRSLQQKGIAKGRFVPLSAELWRSVKAAPNVTVRELRYGADGILTVVLAAPNAASIDTALIAIQQDGFKVTATPRQDATGATVVDLTMRMP